MSYFAFFSALRLRTVRKSLDRWSDADIQPQDEAVARSDHGYRMLRRKDCVGYKSQLREALCRREKYDVLYVRSAIEIA